MVIALSLGTHLENIFASLGLWKLLHQQNTLESSMVLKKLQNKTIKYLCNDTPCFYIYTLNI